jgi:hypothetical protein
MPDNHIDYLEVREYTDDFVTAAKPLIGLSDIVDVAKLCARVSAKADAVDTELEKQGIKRSGVRGDRKDVEAKTEALRKAITKFHSYLNSLDDDVTFDMNAFFQGGNQGMLAALKPADLVQRAGAILRGFEVKANVNLPDAEACKTKLAGARDALSTALGDKGGNVLASIQGTAELMAAREAWLNDYNGGAKRIIWALLAFLGRKNEYRLFFKDLQVNEGGGGTGETPEQEPPPQDTPEANAPQGV